MKTQLTLLALALTLCPARATKKPARPVDWMPEVATGSAQHEWSESTAGERTLTITATNTTPTTVQLGVIESPGVESSYYAVNGRVRHSGVEGTAYLEMWNHFAGRDGGPPEAYFSRTMGTAGLMRNLEGNSDWRDFRLPFNASEGDRRPSRLVINLVLPGRGTVELTPASLRDYDSPAALFGNASGWWPEHWAGWIGAGMGILFGCWGSLIGILWQKGVARGFVMASMGFNLLVGVISLIIGVVAIALKQPYHVWYPFLLIGVILTLVMSTTRRQLLKQLAQAEEQKMAKLDALEH